MRGSMRIDLFSCPIISIDLPISLQHLLCDLGDNWQYNWIHNNLDNSSELFKLKELVVTHANSYFADCGYVDVTLATTNVWTNENSLADFTLPHHHGMSLVSWSFYIDIPKDSGDIVFMDPKGNNSWHYFTMLQINKEKLNGVALYRITPKPGQLLIFPGWLQHYVEPNKTTNTRMSMSGDLHSKEFVDYYNNVSVHADRDLQKHAGNYEGTIE